MKNKKGFTMVELLAVIVLLGILSVVGIVSVTRLISKSRDEQVKDQSKTMVMATQSYLQSNKSEMPKAIGDSRDIPVSELKDSNFLKENLQNSSGEDCMENSYVRVYKSSNTDYVYTPYIYCGNEVVEDPDDAIEPVINVEFRGERDDMGHIQNVSTATLYIEISGGVNGASGEELELDGYIFSLAVQEKGDMNLREIYNSGTVSANRQKEVKLEKLLKDYIDITNVTFVKASVTAFNVAGGRTMKDTSSSAGGSGGGDYDILSDTTPPICSTIENPVDENDWINISNGSKGRRSVTVNCDDLDGSGCIRSQFTRTWPDDSQKEAEYAYISVEDNAGNKSIGDGYLTASNPCESSVFVENSCRVRVNVDTTYPSVDVDSVGAYERTSGNERASGAVNLLSSTSVKKDSANEYTIAANSYTNSDLQSKSYWFNESFNEGVLYEITLKDNIHLDSWKWETNAPYYAENKSNGYQAFRSGSVGENSSGTIPSDMTHSNCGTLSYTISVYLKDEGYRRGRLTISDKAGNKTTLIIEAKIDRTPPSVPTVSFHTFNKAGTSVTTTAYTPKTWSQYSIEAKGTKPSDNKALNGNKTLNPSNGNLSGFKEFKYQGKNAKGSDISGTTTEKFNLKGDDFEGENKIQFSSCDTAGNCSDFTTLYDVWLDTKAPTVRILAQKKNSDDKVTTAKDVTVDNSTKNWKYTIDYKDYEGLVSNWMNASNYKGGVTYQVTISDNVSKASYEWASGHNDDKVAKTTISGKKAETYTMKFTKEGQRSGKLTVKDIAGNTIEVTIKAYLDRTKPTTPTITNPSNENWTNQNIYLTLASSDPTGNAIDGKVSGIGKYQWHYAGKSWSDYASSAKTSYQTTAYSAERNEAAYQRACDKAGNCSSASSTMIRIDKTAPKLTLGHTRSCTSGVGNKVTSSCSDQGTVKSGIQSAPGDKTIRWGKSDTLSFTCTDNAGNSTKKSYTLTYNSCACGENTCKYGCDTCGGGAYTSVYTVSKTCSKEVCEGGHITSDSCLDFEYWNDGECCSILEKDCSYTKSKTCYYPTYSCNCSNCYYGHNTCQYGYK